MVRRSEILEVERRNFEGYPWASRVGFPAGHSRDPVEPAIAPVATYTEPGLLTTALTPGARVRRTFEALFQHGQVDRHLPTCLAAYEDGHQKPTDASPSKSRRSSGALSVGAPFDRFIEGHGRVRLRRGHSTGGAERSGRAQRWLVGRRSRCASSRGSGSSPGGRRRCPSDH